MDTIATECKARRHHPEWTNVYNKTHIRWTTHTPPGLSSADLHMARFCDEVAGRFGEVSEGNGEKSTSAASTASTDGAEAVDRNASSDGAGTTSA